MHTDPPEVLRLAGVLETLPRRYLALMLARVMCRKAPDVADESRPERKAVVVRTDSGGETVHSADALSAGRDARNAPSVASSI